MSEPEIPNLEPAPSIEELEAKDQGAWARLRRHRHRHLAWFAPFVLVGLIGLYQFRKPVAEVTKQLKDRAPKQQAVGGRIRKITSVGVLSTAQVDAQARRVYTSLEPAKFQIEEFNITYTSVDARNGKEIEVNGRVYLPINAGSRPLMAFGPGTTGPGPGCSPSVEHDLRMNWGSYDSVLSEYAGQGYAVALTDYASRGGDNISPYFVGESEARVLLDLVKAMQIFRAEPNFRGTVVGSDIFLAGYSQGGHAALWAEKLRASYAPEIKPSGLILYAPATDMHKTFYDSVAGATTVWLPPYLFAAYQDYYGKTTPAATIFTGKYASTVGADARKYCINNVEPSRTGLMYFGTGGSVSNLFTPAFLQGLRQKNISAVAPDLDKQMKENLAGEPIDVPVLLISGRHDAVILESAQTELAKRLCEGRGSNFRWALSDATHYAPMFSDGRAEAMNWLADITNGNLPASECSLYQ